MKKINVLQVGLGPLGIKIGQFIEERKGLRLAGAVDLNPEIAGQDLGELLGNKKNGVTIVDGLKKVEGIEKIDVAILSTVSDIERITGQLNELLDFSIPVVSTCEELSFPWFQPSPEFMEVDKKAKERKVAILGTGINPGFLMDTLPALLTGVCQDVRHVTVNRFQDAQFRRIPFQNKIGAGLNLAQFEERKQSGSLRHVGLTESMQFIAHSLGWKLDSTEDVISPVIATEDIHTPSMTIKKGDAMGVRQEGRAFSNGEEKIKLIFEAAVGSGRSYDEVNIGGTPNINSRIDGGVNGDIATCAIVLNAIPSVLNAQPGIRTMADIPLVSFWE